MHNQWKSNHDEGVNGGNSLDFDRFTTFLTGDELRTLFIDFTIMMWVAGMVLHRAVMSKYTNNPSSSSGFT